MRKVIWGGTAACLLAGGVVGYWALPTPPERHVTVDAGRQEEQEPAVVAEMLPGRPAVSVQAVPEVIEPIVVEGPDSEPAPAPEVGGAALPDADVRVAALGTAQPPRPDEKPGEEKKMPYAGEEELGVVGQLWQALGRLLNGDVSAETPEDLPASEEQAAPETPRLVPPVLDYHHGEMHCPYPGRCMIPHYPVPPPAAPEQK